MLFCKGKIPHLKLCKTCRVPFVPDAAGQIDGQHECATFPLTIHQRTGSQPGRAKAAVKPGAIQSIHDGVKGLCCQRCRIAAFGDRQVCQACITFSNFSATMASMSVTRESVNGKKDTPLPASTNWLQSATH